MLLPEFILYIDEVFEDEGVLFATRIHGEKTITQFSVERIYERGMLSFICKLKFTC